MGLIQKYLSVYFGQFLGRFLKSIELPPSTGFEDRFFFDSASRRCEPFKFGGYNEAGNVFQSLEQCESMCESYMLPGEDVDVGGDEGCAAVEDSR